MDIRGQEVIGVKLTVEKIEKEKEEEAFESWVTGGYFEGDYIPYSFMEEGKIIANVSANKMTFLQNGVERNYIQIGTVMTDEAYRRQGLAKN